MEVKPGYKQTEVGMQELLTGKKRLPGFSGEWEVKRLGNVCKIATGKKDVNEGNPDGQFPFFTCSRSHTFSDSYSFDTEAILIAGNGEVGNLHYFKGKFEAYQRTYVLSQFSGHVGYLWQQLSAHLADSLGLGKIGSSIPYIKKESLVGFEFSRPKDEAEQIAIAAILSDMDAEIAALEAKLAKARRLKQGMMQELLTGKKRLPGFSGEWEVKRLGDCFALVGTRNIELNDNVVTISAQQGFVRQEEFFQKRVASPVLENYYLIERGHFAYNRSYSNGYPFGAIKRLTRYDKGVVTTLYICFALKPEAESDPTFFEHYFEAGLLNSGLSMVTNEGGRAHGLLNITKADFISREIKRPPLPEQTAIAAILSDMDAEIAALETKVAKARQLKQGMMQELLTGRIRLI